MTQPIDKTALEIASDYFDLQREVVRQFIFEATTFDPEKRDCLLQHLEAAYDAAKNFGAACVRP